VVFPIGIWTFPGGGIKYGETAKKAVIREIKEETGLRIRPTKLITVHEMIVPQNRVHRIIFFYKAKAIGGKLKTTNETSEWKWLTLKEIAKIKNLGHTPLIILKKPNY